MLYYIGPNPTVDLIITRRVGNNRMVLMIKRGSDAVAFPNKWAFPGGFVDTTAQKGELWEPGKETFIEAAKRELLEETGLDLSKTDEVEFHFIGVYDNLERDPRNTNFSWVEAHVFHVLAHDKELETLQCGDDAQEAKWFLYQQLLEMDRNEFAFDHFDIIREQFL